jgi:hypothetical protein
LPIIAASTMRRITFVLSALILIVLGVGCSGIAETPIPTPLPLELIPTMVQLTANAGQTATSSASPSLATTTSDSPPTSPSSTPDMVISQDQNSPTPLSFEQTATLSPTPSPTRTPDLSATATPRSTRTPTVTRTPTLPPAGVQINSPGPMSKVASPLKVTANLHTEPSGNYHVELWLEPLQPGGDPRMLYREVQRMISNPIDWLYLDQDIQFELTRVSELGQLRISVWDTFGRAISINSVDLILLSMGSSSITPPSPKTEPIVIREPTENQLIQGGKLIVSGVARPDPGVMLVELVTTDGSVVGYKEVLVTPSPDGYYVPYTVEVPYQVVTPTWVRLQISESGSRISGIDHLSSVLVLLSP